MSRVGKLPVALPSGVRVAVGDGTVEVSGPKGSLSRRIVDGVSIAVETGQAVVQRPDETRSSRERHGLMRALLGNMVVGVSKGFERKLEIVGVGYRAEMKGTQLVMNLGYSHQIVYDVPAGVSVTVDKQNSIAVQGIDKELVGQVASEIREFRKPDSYKGKGVRYVGEHIRIKAGKSA